MIVRCVVFVYMCVYRWFNFFFFFCSTSLHVGTCLRCKLINKEPGKTKEHECKYTSYVPLFSECKLVFVSLCRNLNLMHAVFFLLKAFHFLCGKMVFLICFWCVCFIYTEASEHCETVNCDTMYFCSMLKKNSI